MAKCSTGPFKGRRLSSLSDPELGSSIGICAGVSDQSLPLVRSLARPHQAGLARGLGQPGRPRSSAQAPGGKMSEAEALAVLGLKAGATAEDIRSRIAG